jgi:hypothetical protein
VTAFRYDDWEKPPRVRDAFERIVRAAERGPGKSELTRSYELPAKAMTADEFAKFERKGRKIDYGAARMDKQILNDKRHEQRAKRHPLIKVVNNWLREWDCAGYLAKHRGIVRNILSQPRNQRRRKLSDMSTMQRRHQEAIRLVHALAFDGLSQAEYCRRHKLDPSQTSRMLTHLCQKEPGLADAIRAICDCATMTSWKNRQQQKNLQDRERGISIVYGYDYKDVVDNGWLSDESGGKYRSVFSGRFKPIAPKPYEPYPEPYIPFDLHQPGTWRQLGFPSVDWNTLYEPTWAIERYDLPLRFGVYDQYRDLSRSVLLKDKTNREVWRIARAIPILDWDARPLGYCPQHWHPVPDIWIGWDPTQARCQRLDVSHDYVEPRFERASNTVVVRRITRRPLCNPTRWIPLPYQATSSKWFAPFTHVNWVYVSVKATSEYAPAERIGPGVYRIPLSRP